MTASVLNLMEDAFDAFAHTVEPTEPTIKLGHVLLRLVGPFWGVNAIGGQPLDICLPILTHEALVAQDVTALQVKHHSLGDQAFIQMSWNQII